MIYCDYNATTPLFPAVKNAMRHAMDSVGNPSSVHTCGRQARAYIEAARHTVATHVNCHPASVVFTSSGTEANNLALQSFAPHEVLVSAIEHASVARVFPQAEAIMVTAQGVIDRDDLATKLKTGRYKLVSVMLANNETGAIQPVQEVAMLAHQYGCAVHCDAVQAFGKIPVDMRVLGVDYMTISAHKIGGPAGVGALIVPVDGPLCVMHRGGGQERRRRGGSENLLGIVGFGAAITEIAEVSWERVALLRDQLERGAEELGAHVLAISEPRLPNTTVLGFPGMRSETLVMQYDLNRISVSAGSACSSGKVETSQVLQAMGYTRQDTVRVSLGWRSSLTEINTFLAVTQKIIQHADTTASYSQVA